MCGVIPFTVASLHHSSMLGDQPGLVTQGKGQHGRVVVVPFSTFLLRCACLRLDREKVSTVSLSAIDREVEFCFTHKIVEKKIV